MEPINGRTPEQRRAFDRWKLIGALVLAAALVVMWMAGLGPGRAAACCAVPEAKTAPAPPPAAPPATSPTTEPASEAETHGAVAPPPEADCPQTNDVEIGFASASAGLSVADRRTLERLAPCLAEDRYEVTGHADSSGNDAINNPLAEARARAVVEFLVAHGVDATRLDARGYGSTQPVADNATPEGRARNRRVEIRPR